MDAPVKQELNDEQTVFTPRNRNKRSETVPPPPEDVIELSDSDSDDGGFSTKKQKKNGGIPTSFLDPIAPLPESSILLPPVKENGGASKQFWKAGDYEGDSSATWDSYTGGMDHVRVHPKFLHSNATSHKWALGAFAELLDNALDEVCNGATYVNIDMLLNKKDGGRMLLVEDNGGGMNPDKMRQCMSLGYSAKSKIANTIGQYGNGFKTSTMRLGADVIVFTRGCGKDGKSITQSIGLLSFTFLRSTGKEDIVVPILDYERKEREWVKIMRSSADDWKRNVDTMVTWSPYSSEAELLQQFNLMKGHGTRIVIYNLWEDDQGQLELDFISDRHDIQIRGVNRDEKNIQMAYEYPNSRHFLTYRHSLRSYVSILYLRLPPSFRIILRGKDVEHHNVVNDMMMSEEVTYRPQPGADGVPRDVNMVAIVTIGFVKDAMAHIDVQGFNVYHKNRLIKPFWRVWNAAGSDGRGVIGVLEANFVEPAHDKQGFERTTVLARLENKLLQMQKTYWSTYCHKIGYAPRRNKKILDSRDRDSSPDYTPSSHTKRKVNSMNDDKYHSNLSHNQGERTVKRFASVNEKYGNGYAHRTKAREIPLQSSSSSAEDTSDIEEQNNRNRRRVKGASCPAFKAPEKDMSGKAHHSQQEGNAMQPVIPGKAFKAPEKDMSGKAHHSQQEGNAMQPVIPGKAHNSQQAGNALQPAINVDADIAVASTTDLQVVDQLKEENRQLKERLARTEEEILGELLRDLQQERDKCKSLEKKLQESQSRVEDLNKEQESLIDIFSEERDRRDIEEENLRKRLRDASHTIEELREKLKVLEQMKTRNGK